MEQIEKMISETENRQIEEKLEEVEQEIVETRSPKRKRITAIYWVVNVLIEPAALVILEIAAGILGGSQNVEIGSGKFPSEVLRVTLLENLRHIDNIGNHRAIFAAKIMILSFIIESN